KCFIDGFILWKFQFLFVYQLKVCTFCFSVINARVFEPIILILFSCENNFRFSFFRVQVSVLNNYNTFKFKFYDDEKVLVVCCVTPLGAIEEDDGTFTVLYTAKYTRDGKVFFGIGRCVLAWK